MSGSPAAPIGPVRVVVGRVGRAHGIHGLVSVDVRTDEPELRFAPDAVLLTDPEESGPLTVLETRTHAGRLLVRLAGVADREAAERLRGTALLVEVDPRARPANEEEWYDRQLVGLTALGLDGRVYGQVTEVVHLPLQDLLQVRTPMDQEVLVPFVATLVPEVDVEGGRVILQPPDGLFEGG